MEGAAEVNIGCMMRLAWIRILFQMYVDSCLSRGSYFKTVERSVRSEGRFRLRLTHVIGTGADGLARRIPFSDILRPIGGTQIYRSLL